MYRYDIFQLPVENDTFEAVGSWCCMAGTVTAHLRLDRKGYVLKEAIPVWCEIKNLSARRIAHTTVSLVQVSGAFCNSFFMYVTVSIIDNSCVYCKGYCCNL